MQLIELRDDFFRKPGVAVIWIVVVFFLNHYILWVVGCY